MYLSVFLVVAIRAIYEVLGERMVVKSRVCIASVSMAFGCSRLLVSNRSSLLVQMNRFVVNSQLSRSLLQVSTSTQEEMMPFWGWTILAMHVYLVFLSGDRTGLRLQSALSLLRKKRGEWTPVRAEFRRYSSEEECDAKRGEV